MYVRYMFGLFFFVSRVFPVVLVPQVFQVLKDSLENQAVMDGLQAWVNEIEFNFLQNLIEICVISGIKGEQGDAGGSGLPGLPGQVGDAGMYDIIFSIDFMLH